MAITTNKLPEAGQRVGVVCGPGEFQKDRQGVVMTQVTDKWGKHAIVLMDDGKIEHCHGLTEVGIGWYVIAAKKADEKKPAPAIKFMKHYVQNAETGVKCRVWYSLDNRVDGRKCVTIYAKGYCDDLFAVLGEIVQNDSDSMTDYFCKDRAVIFEGDALYSAARARAESK